MILKTSWFFLCNKTKVFSRTVWIVACVSLSGLATLLASLWTGLLWQWGSPAWPFAVSSGGALAVLGYFVWWGHHIPDETRKTAP